MRSPVDGTALTAFAFIFSFFFSAVSSLEVAPDSPCSALCIDAPGLNISDATLSSTQTYSVVCNDNDFAGPNSTVDGRKWRSCSQCLAGSGYYSNRTSGIESDTFWFMFNMKFSVAWCTLGFTTVVNPLVDVSQEACFDTCSPIQAALSDNILAQEFGTQYNYCTSNGGAFTKGYAACRDCLQAVPTSQSLSRYVEALGKGCKQRPKAGELLALDADVIATAKVAVPTNTGAATIPTGILVAPPTSNTASAAMAAPSSGLSTGAITAIAVSVAIVVILSALGCIWMWMRRRDRRQAQQAPPKFHQDVERSSSDGESVLDMPPPTYRFTGRGSTMGSGQAPAIITGDFKSHQEMSECVEIGESPVRTRKPSKVLPLVPRDRKAINSKPIEMA